MGYFTARVLLLSLYTEASLAIILINWIAMLYGVWSIHYQWKVAKSWCVLCVIVQAIIWIMGLLDIVTFCSITFNIACVSCIFACLTYTVSIIVIHHYVKTQAEEKDRILAVQQYRAIKANEWVAKALFEHGQYYETSPEDSSIVFGNPNANMRVTILSNPHCNPCARMHLEVERLLDISRDSICVQYIFVFFNESLDDSSRFLISCYDAAHLDTTRKIYSEWYAGEKDNYEKIIKQHNATIHTEKVENEFLKHVEWRKKTGVVATPTVLVNGHILPKEYELEDLTMITNIDIIEKNILQDINGRSTTPLGAD